MIASVGAKAWRGTFVGDRFSEAVAGVLYAGIASSCFAHGIGNWAISKVEGSSPTTYSGVQVIFTVVFAWIFLGEAVGWDRAAGSAATVAGVYVRESRQGTGTEKRRREGNGGRGGGRRARPPRTSIDLGATAVLRVDDDEEYGTTPNGFGSGSVEMAADATKRGDDAAAREDEEETDGAPLLSETKP